MASSSNSAEPLQVPDEVLHASLPANKHSVNIAKKALVAKIITNRVQNRNAAKKILYRAWQNYTRLLITEKGPNMFLLNFREEEQAKEVMQKTPWYVMNHLVSLQYWIPEAAVAELDFSLNPFWIQVQNLPLENLNCQSAITLLQKVGRVVDIEDPLADGQLVRDFVRGKVLVDTTKPLPTGCWIPRVGLPNLWVVYRYKRLQDLCFNCGVIGHEQKYCKHPRAMASYNPNIPKYNQNLCVPTARPIANLLEEHRRRNQRNTPTKPK